MQACVADRVPPAALRDPSDPYWTNVKATDDLLDRLLPKFFERINLTPHLMRKTDYHFLARYVPKESIDPEIVEVLDAIEVTARRARPLD